MKKITVKDIIAKKNKDKIVMLTCYDYSFAGALDEAGVDIILVGDSLANVVLGKRYTREVTFKEMLNHTEAVSKGVERALVVTDMPYVCYQKNPKKALYFARKFISCGADGVKLEWFKGCEAVAKELNENGIQVMGHVGLTPQAVKSPSGFKVQGKDRFSALELVNCAVILEKTGVFSVVLECIPLRVSNVITGLLKVPTIGIGAGMFCDGQVLVLYDFLGLYKRIRPKFARQYSNFHSQIKDSVMRFTKDISANSFPAKEESFTMPDNEFDAFEAELKKQ
ncbi:MAG: 3-methyl-2-oxobutanoate hydroxymethyltransferase [Candidatus Omnitrophota bacterium]